MQGAGVWSVVKELFPMLPRVARKFLKIVMISALNEWARGDQLNSLYSFQTFFQFTSHLAFPDLYNSFLSPIFSEIHRLFFP